MSFSRIFVDTAYILALINPRDIHHQKALDLLPNLRIAHEVWITEAVLTEIGNALAKVNRFGAIRFIESCYVTKNINVVSISSDLFDQAVKFYDAHKDKEWGLTDCISFIVMQEHGLMDAFTSDKHFQQAGFNALLR